MAEEEKNRSTDHYAFLDQVLGFEVVFFLIDKFMVDFGILKLSVT